MEITQVWNDQIPEKDGVKLSVNDVAFSPDGSRIVAAVGNRVLLYRASDGDLMESLRGHKDTVYSVSYSNDGSRFASGGADNVVVIWKNTGQGLLKYNHSAPIQRVKYNPATLLLASCSEVDFGLWTPDQKQVTKEKVPSRIVSVAWSSDGTLLALGMLNGMISIRNQQAEEILKIEKKAPIWCLTFIPEPQVPQRPTNNSNNNSNAPSNSLLDHADNLAVTSWDKDYVLYKLTPKQPLVLVEKQLSYYPLSMHSVNNALTKTSYVILAGSNRQIQILSREGVKLAIITKPAETWLWAVDSHGEEDTMVYGSHYGSVEYMKLNFNSVNSLYKDRYAYRENLTEVIVHHLVTDKKVRIKCKDMIHNLSLYRNKLAVQLLDRICVYESSSDDSVDIHFRLRKERITVSSLSRNATTKLVNNLMVATSAHVLVAVDNVLELYAMDGLREKLWKLEGNVLMMRVDGGLDGREGVLVALSTGVVFRLYLENPFLIELTRKSKGVMKVDINIYKTLLLTIDIEKTLMITDLATQETIFTQQNVISGCFNNEVEDLICFTNTNNLISVVSGIVPLTQFKREMINHQATTQKFSTEIQELHLQGQVLGFRGQKIFCLQKSGLVGIDVPQGANMQKALENGDFDSAYKVACLGATEVEWRLLAMKALRMNRLLIAKNSFARLKDVKYLSLIEAIEKGIISSNYSSSSSSSQSSLSKTGPDRSSGRHRGGASVSNTAATTASAPNSTQALEPRWLAEIMAYEGHFQEAAKILVRDKKLDEAIEMFVVLRKWEEAKTFAQNSTTVNPSSLTVQQAQWLQEIKDWRGAAELFMSMGQFHQAAKIIGEYGVPQTSNSTSTGTAANQNKGWAQVMLEVVRGCPVEDKETLLFCGEKLSNHEDISFAREAYMKAGDYSKLMSLLIQRKLWTDAAKLADDYEGKFDMTIFLSYAEWLVSQDRYEEAMDAFKKCGRVDLSRQVLTELTENAVNEKRFKDAGYYYWMLAKEIELELTNLSRAQSEEKSSAESKTDLVSSTRKQEEGRLAALAAEYEHKADLYYAYASIHSFVTDPFTSFQPEMLFQVARFIINSLGVADTVPLGISKTSTLYTLAKQSMQLGAFKLARNAFDRLSKLQIPEKRLDEIELDMLLVQAKPVRDNPDYLPVCYRCGSTNPLLNPFTNRFAKGDVCTNCGHPFVRSFINFDILPLVEFVPEPRITDDEAMDLIRQPPAKMTRLIEGKGGRWKEEVVGDQVNMLSFQNNTSFEGDQSVLLSDQEGLDLFTQCLNVTLERQRNSYTPVQVDANTLLAMKRSEVFVCKPSSKNKRATFYKNMLAEIPIAISQPCHRFFHLEDFEFAYLSEKRCPYSRLKSVGEYGSI